MTKYLDYMQKQFYSCCPNCDAIMERRYQFCPYCGAKLPEDDVKIILQKLFEAVDDELFTRVDLQYMIMHKFLVLKYNEGYLFVVISVNSNKELVANILNSIYPYRIKYVPLSDYDFATLLLMGIDKFLKH